MWGKYCNAMTASGQLLVKAPELFVEVKREEEEPPGPEPPEPPEQVDSGGQESPKLGAALPEGYDGLAQYGVLTAVSPQYEPPRVYTLAPELYRDYLAYPDSSSSELMERFLRAPGYKMDLPSPDSGIGDTPRDPLPQIFDYSSDLPPATAPTPTTAASVTLTAEPVATPAPASTSPGTTRPSRRGGWPEYGRSSESSSDKVQIGKIFSDVGFKYYFEASTSTSQRREDDRITYINKGRWDIYMAVEQRVDRCAPGQFYGVTMEYIPDPDRPLKSSTVKSTVLLVFREEKSHEEEIKAWHFWHSRQHSSKQRILDADTKNSSGIIGHIEELAHNAITFYWNPLEGPAKINVAVQCLSTDFSNQKGVKGQPLHIQVDTTDDLRENSPPLHRGYCQIKVFCDKGAERKTRDEERRANKRKISATGMTPEVVVPAGRKRLEELYHPPSERSEFYSMSNLIKPPVLFNPTESLEKMDMALYSAQLQASADDSNSGTDSDYSQVKRLKLYPEDRVVLYARQDGEEIFHALHLVPPSLAGLATAIENKYKIPAKDIANIYKRCKKGILVQMDDDVVKHYCNEDTFIIEISQVDDAYNVTLVEL
ncbi:GRHL2 [Cordylochernes scorpioides]|uniref:GRHL2 n=1 Tax=Cordylochernes scorpioides TaxID=51811 RepID=A0ABY6LL78_9ARAC|nr:GRHL2 [Cordylochernes scorpioides]